MVVAMAKGVSFVTLCLLGLPAVHAKSILDVPWEARKSNTIRVTRQACDECSQLEDLYKDNDLVFLLFYERSLVGHHNYKGAIIAGFLEVCKELRFSKVACGLVDMVEDKAYAEKYIDPKTAPAHIAVRAGEPVPSTQENVKKLLAKPGDKATMLWHLKEQFVPQELGEALQISAEAADADQLRRLTKLHEVVIVANLAGDGGANRAGVDNFRAAAQQLVLQGKVPGVLMLPGEVDGSSKKAARKQRQHRQRARVLFVALGRDAAAPSVARNHVAAYVRGELQAKSAELPKAGTGPALLDPIQAVARAAVKKVESTVESKVPEKVAEL
eukprot:TRINITY_DN14750_c0_g2_i2.p1 TRINITY_DN14750_c0_g2~~TRINITY_DN14750_c0_g2_i2.p1  ORF type:complete len:328 (+),score=77.85 TRINITY_DN14750_c0_g2_i2:23-1006(+)